MLQIEQAIGRIEAERSTNSVHRCRVEIWQGYSHGIAVCSREGSCGQCLLDSCAVVSFAIARCPESMHVENLVLPREDGCDAKEPYQEIAHWGAIIS
jgi:hypothetical protein